MQVSIGSKAALLGGLLVVATVLAGSLAHAQQMGERLHVPSGIDSTVSVATLRIPEKAWKHFVKARSAAEHDQMAECDRETEKAIVIAPDFAAAYLLRADSEVRQHSFEAAIADVKEARRAEPNVFWAGVVLAGAYNGLHRYEDARLVLKVLRGSEAESWQAAYEAARAAVGLNDVESALRLSATMLELAPANFADAHLVRTNAFILAQYWSDAQAQMETYLESKGPLEHRAEVLTALENAKRRAREQELQKLALR